jgi:succinyl-diaminopimelate desuccinylase
MMNTSSRFYHCACQLSIDECDGIINFAYATIIQRKVRSMSCDQNTLRHLAAGVRSPMIDFCRRLIQTPSLPGQEGELAALIRSEMEQLDYDDVIVDEVGNVIGVLEGTGAGATVQFNTHLDHVDPGDPAAWPYPPYAATVSDGAIWGRGASDTKGAMAAQIHAMAALKRADLPHAGAIEVVTVVQEEVGGLGTRHLARTRRPDYAVIGEATSNRLALGHRGSTNIIARFSGKSVHAARPAEGINPHFSAAAFLSRLHELPLGRSDRLGNATMAPTLYTTDQASPNVTPGVVDLLLSWRYLPDEDPDEFLAALRRLQAETLHVGCRGECFVPPQRLQSYTGYVDDEPYNFPPLLTPEDDPLTTTALAVLAEAYGAPVPTTVWAFGTDGGHLAKAGVPCVGFGPMEERLAHTVEDRVAIDMLEAGVVGYLALGLALTRLPGAHMW